MAIIHCVVPKLDQEQTLDRRYWPGYPKVCYNCQKEVKASWYKSFLSNFNVSIKAIIPCEGQLPKMDRFLFVGYPEIQSIKVILQVGLKLFIAGLNAPKSSSFSMSNFKLCDVIWVSPLCDGLPLFVITWTVPGFARGNAQNSAQWNLCDVINVQPLCGMPRIQICMNQKFEGVARC